MAFSSMTFLFGFLPLCLVCYFVLPARFRGARNFILLAFSLGFYCWCGVRLLPALNIPMEDLEYAIETIKSVAAELGGKV